LSELAIATGFADYVQDKVREGEAGNRPRGWPGEKMDNETAVEMLL